MPNDEESNFEEKEAKKTGNFIVNESDLINAFSQPQAQDYNPEFQHLNKDYPMSNTNDADREYINIALPLTRAVDDFLGHNSSFSIMLKHDLFGANIVSVGKEGFGMKTLITRRQEQRSRIQQDSTGFFKKKPLEEDNQ